MQRPAVLIGSLQWPASRHHYPQDGLVQTSLSAWYALAGARDRADKSALVWGAPIGWGHTDSTHIRREGVAIFAGVASSRPVTALHHRAD